MPKLKRTINLLPKDELEKTPIGRFFKWSLTVGRYIVIFTELVVILAFISRFKLDQDLAKLHEEVKHKQTIVSSFEELENDVRLLQKRLEIIKKTGQESLRPYLLITELSKLTPIDVSFEELTIREKSILIKGSSLSNVGLSTFLNGLQTSNQFSQINLETVSSKGRKDPTLKFELSAQLESHAL